MSEPALDINTTVSDLMAMDYRYNYSKEELFTDWFRLRTTLDFKSGSQFKPGLKLCQHFFPNFWDIKSSKGVSFSDCWENPVLMENVLEWGRSGMSKLWLSWIRRAVFMRAGLPNSSFYRPHFSRQIILNTKIKDGLLFDPCAGWGGRMLGTVSAGWNYVACEPNIETYDNLMRLVDFLEIQNNVTIHNIPAEDFDYESLDGKVDVILTSPPYFNLEVYSDNSNQSYNKHNKYKTWIEHWLTPLIKNCVGMLNRDRLSCWNAMNFNNCNMASDVIEIHSEMGYNVKYTIGFQSPIANIRTVKNKDLTYVFERS